MCKKDYSFAGWGQHCSKSHKGYIPLADRSENVDDRDDDDEIRETADARDGTDGQTVDELPEMNDASQNEPKRRYGSKEPKAATSKRRQKDSLLKNRIQVQRRRKAKPRLRKNCGQRSSCRTADSCVNLNKSYLSMYHNLFSYVKMLRMNFLRI